MYPLPFPRLHQPRRRPIVVIAVAAKGEIIRCAVDHLHLDIVVNRRVVAHHRGAGPALSRGARPRRACKGDPKGVVRDKVVRRRRGPGRRYLEPGQPRRVWSDVVAGARRRGVGKGGVVRPGPWWQNALVLPVGLDARRVSRRAGRGRHRSTDGASIEVEMVELWELGGGGK